MADAFPVLHVRGNHYDVGYSIGSTFQARIKSYISKSELMQRSILPYYSTKEGRQVVEKVLSLTEKNFPQYVNEIQGIADEAGLSFETMFLNSMQLEIYFGYSKDIPRLTREDLGCSTVYVNRPDVKVIGHNEDCEELVKYLGYFVDATVMGDDGEEEKFTSLCYPGGLPGVAMSFNKHGLIFTVNTLVAPTIGVTTPGDFLQRALLRASDIDDARRILANIGYGVASGFSVNIGSVVDTANQWSVEILPRVNESKIDIKTHTESEDPTQSTYFHMNEFRHMDVKVETAVRSRTRLNTALKHPVPVCARDVRGILGDTTNQTYPIYRTPRPSDGACSVCTGIFDLLDKKLDVYFANPISTNEPLLTFRI